MNLGIIIINYNGSNDTINCVHSLEKSIQKLEDSNSITVCIIDNSSKKEEINKLKSNLNYKNLIIKRMKNRGFGAANNFGVSLLKDKCDYFLFLNNDVIVPENFLHKMIQSLLKYPNVSIIGCKIYLHPEKDKIQSAGGAISFFGYVTDTCLFQNDCDCLHGKNDYEPFFVTGAAFVIKKSDFFELNGFDENIFMYWEDVDLCWRARLQGKKILFTSDAYIYHKFQGSTSRKMSYKRLSMTRFGAFYVLTKNLSTISLIMRLPILFVLSVLSMIIRPIKDRDIKLAIGYVNAIANYLKKLPICLKERHKIQRNRKISEKEILAYESTLPIRNILKTNRK